MADKKKKSMADQDYLSIVLRQLRKSKMGLAGLFFILFLAVIAIFAPFLAEEIPLRISHSNETDEVCDICVQLKESWEVLKLKDGTVLEGKFIRELPVLVFEEEKKVVFVLENVVIIDLEKGGTKRIPESRITAIDRESTPKTLRVKDEDGIETTYKFKFIEEEAGKTEEITVSQVLRLDTESSPHTLVAKDEDGIETTYRGKFLKEVPGKTKRFPKDEVDVVEKDITPNTLRLMDEERTTYTGTFHGEEPGVIEFSVDEKKKEVPASEKVSLEKLPRKHGDISIWPLLRGLDKTDLFLLLGFGIFIGGFSLFLPFRWKGFSRGKAFNLVALILSVPLVVCIVWIVLREGDRQLYNMVPFKTIDQEAKQARTKVTLKETSDAILEYKARNNRYPESLGEFPGSRKDGWGRELVYEAT